ncbi:MAG: LuxR C-terminal-related transcriptional regulator [Planctomycetaceae bacterium]
MEKSTVEFPMGRSCLVDLTIRLSSSGEIFHRPSLKRRTLNGVRSTQAPSPNDSVVFPSVNSNRLWARPTLGEINMQRSSFDSSQNSGPPLNSRRMVSGDDLSEQIDHWRPVLNSFLHSAVVFDSNYWPILLNRTLQQLLSDQTLLQSGDLTVAQLWRRVCEKASRLASDQSRSPGRPREISEVVAVHQRRFLFVGSLLCTDDGRVIGAVLNICPLNTSSMDVQSLLLDPSARRQPSSDGQNQEFQEWQLRTRQAQDKISRLSRRESQVAAYVAEGWSSKRIADALGVGMKTIEKHRANAILKLGVSSTAEMVSISAMAGHRISDQPSGNSAN